jgi:DUF4097 and DUF4098 domain-containing protein YvlB
MIRATSPNPPPQTPRAKPGIKTTTLVLIIIAVVVVAVVIAGTVALILGPAFSVTKQNFTPYSTPVSQNSNSPSSLTVVDTNGGVTVTPWSQTYLFINGTITARGIGTNPNAISILPSNQSGEIVFQVMFPTGSFFISTSYTVDINVYTPTSYQFKTAQATTVNGDVKFSKIGASTVSLTTTNGQLTATDITASSLTLTDTSGSIDFTCTSCTTVTATTTNGGVTANLQALALTGSYTLTSTSGSIKLKLPASGSFKITASTTNGAVTSSGLSTQLTNHIQSTFGLGSAVVVATTTNGSITVTGV